MNQNNQALNHQPADEIDLRTLFLNMWAVRRVVLLAVVLVMLAYWGLWTVKQVLAPSASTYSRIVQFTFKGVEQGRYPNGSPFRMADVVAPSVLAMVYEANGLADQGVSQAAFVQSFNIQPYAPDYNLIVKKYESAISRKGITGEEIAALQERMKSELQQASARSAKVSFRPARGVRIAESAIDKILLDVPRLWAEKAIDSDGVANLDVTIYSSKMFDDDRFKALDYMIAMDLVQDNIRLINNNIDELLKRPNGSVVKDNESGYSLPDLQKAIDDVVSYDLQQLVTPIQDLGVTKNREIVSLYYQYKMRELEQRRDHELSQASLIRETLTQYGQNLAGERPSPAAGATTIGAPQFGDEFLDRVIDLTQKGGDMEYRQGLTNQMLDHRKEAAELDFELAKMNVVLSAVSSKDRKSEAEAEYIAILEASFPIILEKLRDYVEVTNRIYAKLSKQNLGYSGLLYKAGGSDDMVVSGAILTKRDILIFALLVFVTLFGTLVIAMMVRWLKKAK